MRRWVLGSCGAAALAVGVGAAPAMAQQAVQPDKDSIVTVDIENDATAGTDHFYTAGQALNWVGPTGYLPDWLARAGHVLWGSGEQRLSVGLSQTIYTPFNTQIDPPIANDRPYAAELTGDFALIQDTPNWRSDLELDLGDIGPGALGEEVQNGFHHIIGDTTTKGWSYQIHNEPLLEIISDRIYRVPMGNLGPLSTDILPQLSVGLGNERIYALTGAQLRIGQGLDSDFGAARIRPGLTGLDAYTPTRDFTWYAFAGVDGQGVLQDISLNGNSFENSASVWPTPVVAEGQAGLAIIAYGVKVSYTEVVQTKEFHNQAGGLFQFGIFTLSARF